MEISGLFFTNFLSLILLTESKIPTIHNIYVTKRILQWYFSSCVHWSTTYMLQPWKVSTIPVNTHKLFFQSFPPQNWLEKNHQHSPLLLEGSAGCADIQHPLILQQNKKNNENHIHIFVGHLNYYICLPFCEREIL